MSDFQQSIQPGMIPGIASMSRSCQDSSVSEDDYGPISNTSGNGRQSGSKSLLNTFGQNQNEDTKQKEEVEGEQQDKCFKLYIDSKANKQLHTLLRNNGISQRILQGKKLGNPRDWLYFLMSKMQKDFEGEKDKINETVETAKTNQYKGIFDKIYRCLMHMKDAYHKSVKKLRKAMKLIINNKIQEACKLLRVRDYKGVQRTLRLNRMM